MTAGLDKSPMQAPLSGRLAVRQTTDGLCMVGLLQLPESFVPIEDVAYLMITHGGQVDLNPQALDTGFINDPNAQRDSVSGLMRQNIWRSTSCDEALVVRFREALPETNEWVVYGPTRRRLFAGIRPEGIPHFWLDVGKEGKVAPIPSPMEGRERGAALCQLLTTEPVWPSANGKMYRLPALAKPAREELFKVNQITAAYGAGEIDADEARRKMDAINEDACMNWGSHLRSADGFPQYLAAMRDAGLLTMTGPETAEDLKGREELALNVIKDQVAESRKRELGELSAVMGIKP